MRLLLSGSSGGIGAAVKAAALARGYEVVELNRADYDLGGRRLLREGTLDAFVFATGTCPVKPLALTSAALFEDVMKVNCGYFLDVLREIVSEKLYAKEGFTALAVSSVSATEGWPGGAAYCASKGALSALCRAADAELKAKGVRVKAIEPRYVKTRMFEACAGRMGVSSELARDPKELAEEILNELG